MGSVGSATYMNVDIALYIPVEGISISAEEELEAGGRDDATSREVLMAGGRDDVPSAPGEALTNGEDEASDLLGAN